MKVRLSARPGGAHLSYCTNIHPGDTWEAHFANLQEYIPQVKRQLAAEESFGIGLRLSAAAAGTLSAPEPLGRFKGWLTDNNCYVFTINAFPYGPFHGTRVKEGVYQPDWSNPERVRYSNEVAALLAQLLDEQADLAGSISSVPGCFLPLADQRTRGAITAHLLEHALTLWQLQQTQGKTICLGLEPEPACLLETTAEAVRFFQQELYSSSAILRFAALSGLTPSAAESALRTHLGVCLDACHAAVEFEDPGEGLRALRAAGIPLAKLQVTTGLALSNPGRAQLEALRQFADDVYLHQVVIQTQGSLRHFLDLPEALAREPEPREDWRVHFHVPVFHEQLGQFQNTQQHLVRLLQAYCTEPSTAHLEVETYTWDVLPPELRSDGVVSAICRELEWTRAQLR